MIDVLVDTDILIDSLRKHRAAVTFLAELETNGVVAISTVTQIELFVGCRNKSEQRKMEKYLRRFEVASLNEAIAQLAVSLIKQYRLSHGLVLPDSLVAATALVLGLPLASKNQRHFRYISGLNVVSYP